MLLCMARQPYAENNLALDTGNFGPPWSRLTNIFLFKGTEDHFYAECNALNV